MKISIIIPVYYNEENLEDLYADLKSKVLGKIGEYEIVFVDDGSGDDSWNVMNRIREKDDNIRCVKLSRNFGEHCALQAGLSVCTGDCAVTKQADLQEDSSLIIKMYESWKNGNKVVLAARATRKDSASTKLFGRQTFFKFNASLKNCAISSSLYPPMPHPILVTKKNNSVCFSAKEMNLFIAFLTSASFLILFP